MSKDTQSVENAAVCFLECSPAQLCMRVFYCTASGIFVTPVSCGHHLCSLHPSLHRSHNSACPYLPAAPPGPAVLLFPAVACVVTLWAGVSCEQQSNKASASDKGSPWKRKALSILPAILPCLKQHWSKYRDSISLWYESGWPLMGNKWVEPSALEMLFQ